MRRVKEHEDKENRPYAGKLGLNRVLFRKQLLEPRFGEVHGDNLKDCDHDAGRTRDSVELHRELWFTLTDTVSNEDSTGNRKSSWDHEGQQSNASHDCLRGSHSTTQVGGHQGEDVEGPPSPDRHRKLLEVDAHQRSDVSDSLPRKEIDIVVFLYII